MDPSQVTPSQPVSLFYHPASLEHDTGQHPESARRLRGITALLARQGIPEASLIMPPPVDHALLAEVHDSRYIDVVAEISRRGGGYWDLDTPISPGSYNAALLGAGAAVAAVDAVMSGSRAAFALVRPPGHHALYASAMGFCLFNNVAVAAQHAVRNHGLSRVLIVDWDVHHGNGTQDYFYNRDDVLFFSSHRYPFYPGTGGLYETGAGAGKGYTVNVPLPAGVGDSGYVQLLAGLLVPLVHRYRPELLLVSAGYDSHLADPLGGMAVTTAGFAEMARIVRMLADEIDECGGRVAAILEGGYNVEALSASVAATIGSLGAEGTPAQVSARGESSPGSGGSPAYSPAPSRRAPDISGILSQVKRIHRL